MFFEIIFHYFLLKNRLPHHGILIVVLQSRGWALMPSTFAEILSRTGSASASPKRKESTNAYQKISECFPVNGRAVSRRTATTGDYCARGNYDCEIRESKKYNSCARGEIVRA